MSPIPRAREPYSPSISRKQIITAVGSALAPAWATRESLYCMGRWWSENDQGPGHIEPGGNAQNLTPCSAKCCAFTSTATALTPFRLIIRLPVSTTDKQEIWAYGLRNPFRNSFDRSLGTFFIGDVGQDTREEIDAQAAKLGGGENYGWRVREGSIQNPSYPNERVRHAVNPAYDYPHTIGQTLIGGYAYRGQNIRNLRGIYVFADYFGPNTGDGTGRIFTLNFDGTVAAIFTISRMTCSRPRWAITRPEPVVVRRRRQGRALYLRHRHGNIFQIVRGR